MSARANSFQNLTIDQSTSQTRIFISTFTPTPQWIANWRKGRAQTFQGDIQVMYLDSLPNLNSSSYHSKSSTNTVQSAQTICWDTYYYEEVPPVYDEPGMLATVTIRVVKVTNCMTVDDGNDTPGSLPPYSNGGGGGSGGAGGGNSTPQTPSRYNPCDTAIPVLGQAKPHQKNGVLVMPEVTPCDDLKKDCAGVVGGKAYINPDCNTCMGGTTRVEICPSDIINNTKDTCISKTVGEALLKNIQGIMGDIIKNFNSNTNVKINIYDGLLFYKDTNGNNTGIPKPGETTNQKFIGSKFYADITLATNFHANTSKENIITTLIHETIHAYLGYTSNNFLKTETDHNVIASKYITPMANYLRQYFNIPLKDAYALAWSGVSDAKAYKDVNDDFEYTMSDGNKITKAETRNLSGLYKLSSNVPDNYGYFKGIKFCD
jgi:hypothetical protein